MRKLFREKQQKIDRIDLSEEEEKQAWDVNNKVKELKQAVHQ